VSHDLLILGASTRAAAFSAIQCGFHPRCADYFADRDLVLVCPVDRIDPRHAARQFVEFAESLPSMPWFYTGGFENHPDWVERIARRHTLWGIDAHTLRLVRDPVRVAELLAGNSIPCPEVRSDPQGLPRDGSWLRKPRASGGGRGIEPLIDQTDAGARSHYFQERVDGPSISAVFMGERSPARACLIGVTRQLIGVAGSPFGYLGSIGPVTAAEPLFSRLEALGNVLAFGFGLAGWFGVDFILRDGVPWPVEVNPRYTASLEIFEMASRRSLLPAHRRACDASPSKSEAPARAGLSPGRVIAKCILHAPRRLVAPEIVPDENGLDDPDPFLVRSIADIPWPGTSFDAGEPVMTLMTDGSDLSECRSRMVRLERTWMERLGIIDDERTAGQFSSLSWH
jgi:predicted ATP-grasp superfamily ATP-dependent carboligase